jgi:hypothetical protein
VTEREALQLALDATAKASAMSDLAAGVDGLSGALRLLRVQIAEERVWRRRFMVALMVLAVSIVLQLASTALLVRVALDNGRVLETIHDVTSPEAQAESNRRTGVLIDQLVERITDHEDANADYLACRFEVIQGVHVGECPRP